MTRNMEILIAGRSEAELATIKSFVDRIGGVSSESLLMVNGNTDPLKGLHDQPDVLILHVDQRTTEALQSLSERPVQDLPAVLLFGDELPADAVRYAVRAGVRDVIGADAGQDLASAVNGLMLEQSAGRDPDEGQIIAVMNAKGGSGATFLASNLAHLAATTGEGETVAVDLDFQFGSLPHYFDVTPKRSLLDALSHVHELDRVAIEAYTAVHSSGLSIMAPLPDVPCSTDFDVSERIRALVPILRSRFKQIVFDVPRHIDEISSPILEQADHVLIVLQQSLPSVRDAVRLKTTLIRELGIPQDRVRVLVNRHLKSRHDRAAGHPGKRSATSRCCWCRTTSRPSGRPSTWACRSQKWPPSSPVVKALGKLHAELADAGNQAGNHARLKGNTAIERLKQWSPF